MENFDFRILELEDPEKAFSTSISLRKLADRLERRGVKKALDRGWSWARIAEALGVSRQAVHKKYARIFKNKEDQDDAILNKKFQEES